MLCALQGADEKEVSITHVDQLSNPWAQLFTALVEANSGYMHVRPQGQGGAVFSYAMAQDMYRQCFPTATIHLVYSGKLPTLTTWLVI